MDGKRAKIHQPNTAGILRVEFASSVVHFLTFNSSVGTTILSNATHIESKSVFLLTIIYLKSLTVTSR
jgi:hypothetical protein